MNAPPVLAAAPAPLKKGPNILLTILGLACLLVVVATCLLVYGVTSYLRLGSEARALRNSFTHAAAGGWHRNIEVNIGSFTMGLARAGIGFAPINDEARQALGTVRAGQVGIYELDSAGEANPTEAFAAADQAMEKRGWERLAIVARQDVLVSVYVPQKLRPNDDLTVCFAVLHDRQLVIGSAQGNLEPLMKLALSHAPWAERRVPRVQLSAAVAAEAGGEVR